MTNLFLMIPHTSSHPITHSIELDSSQFDSSLLAYLSAEHELATKRLSDLLGVLVDCLFLIYCPLQQVAYHFLIHIVHEPSIAVVCSLLQQRKEFGSCDKVITQQQMR